jgi:hypothetical protein
MPKPTTSLTDAEGTLWSLLRSAVSDGVAAEVAGTHRTYEAMAAHLDGLARDRLTDPRALRLLARVPATPTGTEEADARRWRWLRDHAHIGIGEDYDLYLGVCLGDGVEDSGWREQFPWLTPQQRAVVLGTSREDQSGILTDPAFLDAAADAAFLAATRTETTPDA